LYTFSGIFLAAFENKIGAVYMDVLRSLIQFKDM
jgi:hypothetical protein